MSQPTSSQDCLSLDLELAKFGELVEEVAWRILDIQKSAENIHHTAYSYHDVYPNRVTLKHAAADL